VRFSPFRTGSRVCFEQAGKAFACIHRHRAELEAAERAPALPQPLVREEERAGIEQLDRERDCQQHRQEQQQRSGRNRDIQRANGPHMARDGRCTARRKQRLWRQGHGREHARGWNGPRGRNKRGGGGFGCPGLDLGWHEAVHCSGLHTRPARRKGAAVTS